MRLKDKVIIITGATSGIGKSLAIRCVSEGAKVLVHGINKADGEKLVNQLGESAYLCIEDLNDLDSPKKIVDCAISAFGKIDSVVNNAAAIERNNLLKLTAESFSKTITINLQSALFLIQAAFPYLKQNQGNVLNIGSINAYTGESLGKENIPSGKMSTPDQLAAACIYWLGDESKPFTGSVVDLEQFSIIGRNPEK